MTGLGLLETCPAKWDGTLPAGVSPFFKQMRMNKRFWLLPFLPGVFFLAFLSCSDEAYDLNRPLDKTVLIGGDSLYFPLGETRIFTLDVLLGEGAFEGVLKLDENGCYVLRPDPDQISLSVAAVDTASLHLPDVSGSSAFPLPPLSGGSVDMDQVVELELVSEALPEEILSLERIDFSNAVLEVGIEFAGLDAEALGALQPDLAIQFPAAMRFPEGSPVDSRNALPVDAFNMENGFSQSLPLESLQLDPSAMQDYRLELSLPLRLAGRLSSSAGLPASVDVRFTCSLSHLQARELRGVFDPVVPEWNTDLDVGLVPDAFRNPGANLDFSKPYILISVDCNADIPMYADVEFTPWGAGGAWTDLAQEARIHLPAQSERAEGAMHYYLCHDQALCPADGIFVQADVPSLFRHMPDLLLVNVKMHADTARVHSYSLEEEYQADVSVFLDIPIVFGEELFMPFGDTLLSGIPESMSMYMEGDELVVYGEAFNTYPMDFLMEMQLFDAERRLIPLETGPAQMVEAASDGQTSRSLVEFRFVDRDGILDERPVRSMFVSCQATNNAEAVGMPVRASSMFRGSLKLKKTGGFAFDAEELLDGMR